LTARQATLDLCEPPVHFVGIGGYGMSALAELALGRGLAVQGTDLKASPATERLTRLGAKIALTHSASAIDGAKTVVFTSAVGKDHPELAAARQKQLTVLHRSDLLNKFLLASKGVTVTGAHGKSTTSAMIVHVLAALGEDPSAAIGGDMLPKGSTARTGKGGLFVAEADESDGTFLKYRPFVGVVTNIALDHMEHWRTQDRLIAGYREYLSHVDPEGVAVIGWDGQLARDAAQGLPGRRLTFGFVLGAEIRGLSVESRGGRTFFEAVVERDLVAVDLPMMGRHNVENALACLAVVRALELDVKKAAEALADYPGVARRMTHVHGGTHVHVYDDYAHNPGKLAACVKTLRAAFPRSRLHVVFQPHRFSRLETMYDAMLDALAGADRVYVVPVFAAGEKTTEDFSPKRLAEDIARKLGVEALPCDSLEAAATAVVGATKGPTATPHVVLTVGAGDVDEVAHDLAHRLAP
jgi:UDP-N-acetylmuramate--alanine ligase